MVANDDVVVLVKLVGIGGKDGVHGVGARLAEFDAKASIEVAPWFALGCHIVGKRGSEFVDYADLLERIVTRAPFHF